MADDVKNFVGLSSVWSQIKQQLHPELVNQLEMQIGHTIIEDSIDHFNQAYSLAEILCGKISDINQLLCKAQSIPKYMFEPSFVEQYTNDLLQQQNIEKYFQQKKKLDDLLSTKSVQRFRETQQPQSKPLAAQPLNIEFTKEFIDKVKQILVFEHKELDQKILQISEAIYNNHKIERISRKVYRQYQEAEQAVSQQELRNFSNKVAEFMQNKRIKEDDELLNELQDPTDLREDKLAQSLRPGQLLKQSQLKPMDLRPGSGIFMQSFKQPPRPLTGIKK
ncbi:Hypothetical_protein [Hexamita inflata]|uniref:Hypothetical_protein n=1 Tax=Hexamita inflata TaxID=28002 RepID=A0ABP1HVU5_9EUKA